MEFEKKVIWIYWVIGWILLENLKMRWIAFENWHFICSSIWNKHFEKNSICNQQFQLYPFWFTLTSSIAQNLFVIWYSLTIVTIKWKTFWLKFALDSCQIQNGILVFLTRRMIVLVCVYNSMFRWQDDYIVGWDDITFHSMLLHTFDATLGWHGEGKTWNVCSNRAQSMWMWRHCRRSFPSWRIREQRKTINDKFPRLLTWMV